MALKFTDYLKIAGLVALVWLPSFCEKADAEAVTTAPQPASPVITDEKFAANLFASLPDVEKDYYGQVFAYSMIATQPGQPYEWKSNVAAGRITAQAAFISKSNSYCRPFTEQLTVDGKTASSSGYGCRREGRDGWCRLKPNAGMLSCALEPPETSIGRVIRDGSERLDRNQSRARSAENNFDHWLRHFSPF